MSTNKYFYILFTDNTTRYYGVNLMVRKSYQEDSGKKVKHMNETQHTQGNVKLLFD